MVVEHGVYVFRHLYYIYIAPLADSSLVDDEISLRTILHIHTVHCCSSVVQCLRCVVQCPLLEQHFQYGGHHHTLQ